LKELKHHQGKLGLDSEDGKQKQICDVVAQAGTTIDAVSCKELGMPNKQPSVTIIRSQCAAFDIGRVRCDATWEKGILWPL
jgi:hypothetical protein